MNKSKNYDIRTTFIVGVNPSDLAITPDNKFAYVTNSNNCCIPGCDTVTLLNLKTGLKELTISDPSFDQPYRIAIDHRGKYAYVCNGSPIKEQVGKVSIINTRTNKVCGVITGFDGACGIVLSKSKAYVTNYGASGGVGGGNGKTVSVVCLRKKKIIGTIEVDLAPCAITMSPCSRLLYVVCYVDGMPGTGTIKVVDRKTNTVTDTIKGFSGPYSMALTKCGLYGYVSNFGSNNFAPFGTTVSMVDLKKNQIIKNIEVGIQPSGIAISDDYLYVSNYNALYASPNYQNLTCGEGTINIICLKKNIVIAPVIALGNSLSTLVISPNKKTLYVCKYEKNTVDAISLS